MKIWYAITWGLNIIPLGTQRDIDAADRAARLVHRDVMTVADESALKKLKMSLKNV